MCPETPIVREEDGFLLLSTSINHYKIGSLILHMASLLLAYLVTVLPFRSLQGEDHLKQSQRVMSSGLKKMVNIS